MKKITNLYRFQDKENILNITFHLISVITIDIRASGRKII